MHKHTLRVFVRRILVGLSFINACACVCMHVQTLHSHIESNSQKHTALTHTLPCHSVRLCNPGFQNRRVG